MNNYPFDIQECTGVIEPVLGSKSSIELVARNISYDGPKDLLKYVLIDYSFEQANNQTVTFKLKIGRQVLTEALSTIFPTILISMVSFTTNYYGPEHFEAVVAVNLTAFLVIVTLFIGVFNRYCKVLIHFKFKDSMIR